MSFKVLPYTRGNPFLHSLVHVLPAGASQDTRSSTSALRFSYPLIPRRKGKGTQGTRLEEHSTQLSQRFHPRRKWRGWGGGVVKGLA